VITTATLGKIRRMYFRDGLSLSEISRRTSLSRNTIRAWLRKPQGSEPRYQRAHRPGKLAAFEAMLEFRGRSSGDSSLNYASGSEARIS
jgi:transposase